MADGDKPPFDPNQPFQPAKPPFDPNQPFDAAPDWGAPQLKAAVTDIPHEMGQQYSQAWEGAKKLNPFHDASNESLLEQGKNLVQGLGSAAYLATGVGPAIIGAGRSLYGHTAAEAEHLLSGLAPTVPEEKLKQMPSVLADQIRRQQRNNPAEGYQQHAGEFEEASAVTMPRGRAVPLPARPTPGPFGVTLSAGQASGDLPLIQREQSALRGAAGPPAQHRAQAFKDQQTQQLEQAQEAVQRSLDPFGYKIADTPQEAGALAQKSVQTTAAMRKAQSTQNYKIAEGFGGEIHADVFRNMGVSIKNDLSSRASPVIVDDKLTPYAAEMVKDIDRRVSVPYIQNRGSPLPPPNPNNILGVTLNGVDQMRKRLSAFRQQAKASGNGADARAAQAVIDSFDARIDSAVNSKQFRGDPRAVTAWNDARAFYSDYRKTYSQGKNDPVGRVVEQVLGKNSNQAAIPNDVADFLYGSTGTNPSSLNVNVANRVKKVLGDQSPEWIGVKQGLFSRLTEPPAGVTDWGSQKISNNLNKFLNGDGKELSAAVFSPQERALLQRYADLHKQLVVPQAGANWSNTATFAARVLDKIGGRIGMILGGTIGGFAMPHPWGIPVGMSAAYGAQRAGQALQARAVAKQMPLVTEQLAAWRKALAKARAANVGPGHAGLMLATANLARVVGLQPQELAAP